MTLTTANFGQVKGEFFATMQDLPDGGDGGSARSLLEGRFEAPGCPEP